MADIDPLRMIEAELVILLSEAPAIASKQPQAAVEWAFMLAALDAHMGWLVRMAALKLQDCKHKTVFSNSLVGSGDAHTFKSNEKRGQ